jgi:hypothetical protein
MPHDWSHLVFSTILANEQYRSLTLPVLLGTQQSHVTNHGAWRPRQGIPIPADRNARATSGSHFTQTKREGGPGAGRLFFSSIRTRTYSQSRPERALTFALVSRLQRQRKD